MPQQKGALSSRTGSMGTAEMGKSVQPSKEEVLRRVSLDVFDVNESSHCLLDSEITSIYRRRISLVEPGGLGHRLERSYYS
jgi:hypothetical protein